MPERVEVRLTPDAETVLKNCPLTALATTATTPHIRDLSHTPPHGTILHVSLRNLTPKVILASDNTIDNTDHICRAQTSVHLAEQLTGNRDFIRSILGDILLERAGGRSGVNTTTIFSPFGLGILDLAVAHFLFGQALRQGLGTVINSFFPAAWTERTEGR